MFSLKFHTKYLTDTLKDAIFYTTLQFYELLDLRTRNRVWHARCTGKVIFTHDLTFGVGVW